MRLQEIMGVASKSTLPPLSGDAAPYKPGGEMNPKRLTATFEELVKKAGYKWAPAEMAYVNKKKKITIQVNHDNSVLAYLPDGTTRKFGNLGDLFIRLSHNKDVAALKKPKAGKASAAPAEKKPETKSASAKKPAKKAKLKESAYTRLSKFLYS